MAGKKSPFQDKTTRKKREQEKSENAKSLAITASWCFLLLPVPTP
jgi:hypothetical protein